MGMPGSHQQSRSIGSSAAVGNKVCGLTLVSFAVFLDVHPTVRLSSR